MVPKMRTAHHLLRRWAALTRSYFFQRNLNLLLWPARDNGFRENHDGDRDELAILKNLCMYYTR